MHAIFLLLALFQFSCLFAPAISTVWTYKKPAKNQGRGRNAGNAGGGKAAAEPYAFPDLARIAVGSKHVCTGTIVKRDYVVTAAHCVVGKDKKEVTVIAGDHKLSDKDKFQQEVKVKQIFIHHKFE